LWAPWQEWRAPRRQGGDRCGKLKGEGNYVPRRVEEAPDISLSDLAAELAERAVTIHPSNPSRFLRAHGPSRKKTLIAAERGAWILSPRLPDLNPIEMAFAKPKAHLRKRAVRTVSDRWQAFGQIYDFCQPGECLIYVKAAGYDPV